MSSRSSGPRPVGIVLLSALLVVVLLPGAVGGEDEATWSARDLGNRGLNDLSFAGQRGWAVGDSGTVLVTADGGENWNSQTSGTGTDLRGVSFSSGTRGWAVGSGGLVLQTSDGGATWTTTNTGTGTDLHGVEFVDDDHGWAVGVTPFPTLASVVLATDDGGQTWTKQLDVPGFILGAVSFADGDHGFVGGQLGAAYRTDDGGQTWLPMAVPAGLATINAVLRVDDRLGFLTVGNTVYRTTDGGVTWPPALEASQTVYGLAASGSVIFAVGGEGLAARSADGGDTWNVAAAGTSGSLRAVAALSGGSAVAVGRRPQPAVPDAGVAAVYSTAEAPPLQIGLNPQSCGGDVDIDWTHGAAGYQVGGAGADLTGDGNDEIVLSGLEGIRALVPFRPTAEATLWELPFQAVIRDVFIADVTGDGEPEVVAASIGTGSRAGITVVEGATGEVLWSRQISGGASYVQTGDVTGDGRDEIVVYSGGRTLTVLDGTAGNPIGSALPLGGQAHALALGDLTGDGRPEAALAMDDGRALAVRLAGGPQLLWTHEVPSGTLWTVAVGDVTGDGRNDVVVAGRGLRRSVTQGRGDDSGSTQVGPTAGYLVAVLDGADGALRWDYGQPRGGSAAFRAVALADLIGDGRLDVAAHASRIDDGHLVALQGTGRQVAGASTLEPYPLWRLRTTRPPTSTSQGAYTLTAGDGTGDGVAEVYVGLWPGHLIVAGAPAAPSESDPAVDLPVGQLLWEAARRGPMAHVSLYEGADGPLVLSAANDNHVALRDAATGAIAWQYDGGGGPSVAVGDFDGDGQPDIGVATTAGRVYGLDAAGGPLRPDRDVFLPREAVGVVAADTTGDGTDELVAAALDGSVWAVDPMTSEPVWQTTVGAGATGIVTGGQQVVVGTSDGRAVALDARSGVPVWQAQRGAGVTGLTYSEEAGLFAVGDAGGALGLLTEAGSLWAEASVGTSSVTQLAAADMTGDGREEFALVHGATYRSYDRNAVELWRYNAPGAGTRLAVGDLTGDGRADVIGGGLDGQAHALAGVNGQRLWSVPNGLSGPLAIADVTGDGVGEALITQRAGPSRLRTVSVDGEVTSTCTLRKEPHAAVVADVTGDGVTDVVMTMREGDVYLFRGAGG